MYSRVSKSLCRVLALASVALLPVALAAQVVPAAKGNSAFDSPSRWDIFAGYSYLSPKATVNGTPYQSIDFGGIVSVARYFNRNLGLEFVGDVHSESQDPHPLHAHRNNSNDDLSGGSEGLIFRFPSADITPFVHALVGFERVGSVDQPENYGVVLTAGGGLDYGLPWFDHHFAFRVFQADYQYSHVNFGVDGRGNFNIARLSTGVVYHIGSVEPPPPITLACSINPTTPIFAGDPVTVTATPGMVNPKMTPTYAWTGTGVTGTGTSATVATGALAPGTYSVRAVVTESKAGSKAPLRPGQIADCSSSFTVKEFEPPTITCSANPTTIKPGETSTVTAVGLSPQNRPLTYSYTATAGSVSGSGATAAFSSAGAPTGAVGITCTVNDDKGHTATANTSVTITAPYVPPIPHASALCSITFDKDKKRPTRVDNEAKACLDQVALDLQNQAGATAVVVGESNEKEKTATAKEAKRALKHKHVKVIDSAAERAVNTKEYLVTEKGIDAARVSVATGATDAQTVEDYLVPSGATFANDVQGTTPVDETAVKPVVRKPLPERKHGGGHKGVKPPVVGVGPGVKPPQ